MQMKRHWARLVMAVAFLATVLASVVVVPPVVAEPPQPAKGRGDKCVMPTDWMRRNHMKGLIHHRREAVHEGIRTPTFDLNGCIDCHQVKGDDGKPVKISSPKHFCRTCHDYAGVRLDCFECHASRPEQKTETTTGQLERSPHHHTGLPGHGGEGDVAALNRYLEGAGK